jgi:hypothetical protein
MTSSHGVASEPAPAPTPLPAGIRIASTLCWIVGILTILGAFAIGIPGASGFNSSLVPLVINVIAGIGVCAAAYLVRQRRRLGVLVVVFAWALPTAVAVLSHQPARGSILLFGALLLLAANWKYLR